MALANDRKDFMVEVYMIMYIKDMYKSYIKAVYKLGLVVHTFFYHTSVYQKQSTV